MKAWSARDAEARFGELLETCLTEGPQMVTKHGEGVAVLIPVGEWRRLNQAARPTLKDLLLAAAPRGDLALPRRGRLRRRPMARLARPASG